MEINYGVKVSVVIAVYNAEKYLPQALNSLINQTLTNIEIICVDDGSSDDSVKILDSFSEQDERIKVVLNKEQSDGAALARNIGISHASGECLIVLDSDDFFEKDMLEKAYNRLKEKKSDLVVFNGYTYDNENCLDIESSDILRNKYLPVDKDIFSPKDIPDNLFQISIGAAWNILISREVVSSNQLKFSSYASSDDICFVCMVLASSKKIAILKDRLVHYRFNNQNSQTNCLNTHPKSCCLALYDLKQQLEEKGLFDFYKKTFAKRCMELISLYFRNTQTYDSLSYLFNELKNKYLYKLGLKSISRDIFCVKWHRILLELIINNTPEEYLMKKAYRFPPFDKEYVLSNSLEQDDVIAIYGAGEYGKLIFHHLFSDNYNVIGIFDKQFKRMGYPIQDPKSLITYSFNVIIVSVIESIARQIIIDNLNKILPQKVKIITVEPIISNY